MKMHRYIRAFHNQVPQSVRTLFHCGKLQISFVRFCPNQFYEIYRVYKFHNQMPQSVRTLFHYGKFQISFVRSCPNEFYEIYRVYKFRNQMPQSVRTLFQSRFISLCPWRSHNARYNDFNLGLSLYVLEGVIKWGSTIATSVCFFMSLKES